MKEIVLPYSKKKGVLDVMLQPTASDNQYDAIVTVYHTQSSSDDYELEILKGSFEELYALLEQDKPPLIKVVIWDEMMGVRCVTDFMCVYAYTSSELTFSVKAPNTSMNKEDASQIIPFSLIWDNQDSIYWQ